MTKNSIKNFAKGILIIVGFYILVVSCAITVGVFMTWAARPEVFPYVVLVTVGLLGVMVGSFLPAGGKS